MLEGLRASGLKLTPQRLAIVKELAGDVTHPTAQELFDRLSATLPTTSFATLYNTLGTLAEAGLCQCKSFGPGPARFDPNTEAHHHAVCDRCGSVADVPIASAAQPIAAVGDGFSVRVVERIYRGLCASCQGAS
jgi:Fur family peroxide stress response transcriptional regulator